MPVRNNDSNYIKPSFSDKTLQQNKFLLAMMREHTDPLNMQLHHKNNINKNDIWRILILILVKSVMRCLVFLMQAFLLKK